MFRSERLADVLRFEHDLTRRLAALDLKTDRAGSLAPSRPLLTHGHQRANPPFIPRPPRLDALAQPRFLTRQPLVELLLRKSLSRQPLLPFPKKGLVVAGPRGQLPAVDFDDARGDPLEEGAVVRDEEQRAGKLGEEGFQPDNRVEIEMIGRLVEEQHVGVGDEGSREQDAASPSARQRVDAGVGRQVEARQHQLDALFNPPSVSLFEVVLEAPELLEKGRRPLACEIDGRSVIGRDEMAQLAEALGHHVEDRTRRRERDVLVESGQTQARRRRHRTGIGWLLAADDPEQRGFARIRFGRRRETRSPRSSWSVHSSNNGSCPNASETRSRDTRGIGLRRGWFSSTDSERPRRSASRYQWRCTAHGPRSTVRTPFACRGGRRGRRSEFRSIAYTSMASARWIRSPASLSTS